jgi:hypothetical protein
VCLAALAVSYAPASAAACAPFPPFVGDFDRIGFNVVRDYGKRVDDYAVGRLRAGWYLDYSKETTPSHPAGMAYVRVLRTPDMRQPDWQAQLEPTLAANPGAIWLVGNEPDRDLQDGVTADVYAQVYHDVYTYIKAQDPTAVVGIAGIVQPTPIRLRYLDEVLAAYLTRYGSKPQIDYWNVHGFILREGDLWGAGVPPGLGAYAAEGRLYEVWDHGDIEIFKQQIIDFRVWMAKNGYRTAPLMVSEYGILFPPEYDAAPPPTDVRYDHPFVRDFMLGTFDYFLDYKDPQIGMPGDDNRLVQSWSWYSLNDYVYDPSADLERGFNGNLFDHDSGAITPLGEDFAAYAGATYVQYADAAIRTLRVDRTAIEDPNAPGTLQIEVAVQNRGNLPARDLQVRLWQGLPGRGVLIGTQAIARLAVRCSEEVAVEFTWSPDVLAPGYLGLTAEVVHGGATADAVADNDRTTVTLRVGPDELPRLLIPHLSR